MKTLIQDLRYALRMLRSSPGFTVVAVLTLALGIGANTAIFSVVNAVLIRPLPYPDPERLVFLTWQSKENDRVFTAKQFEFCKLYGYVFRSIAAYRGSSELLLEHGTTSKWVNALRISDAFFRTLGVSPTLGREFSADEIRPGGPQAVVLSEGLWRRAFSADPGIIGRQVRMNNEGYMVVGIMPSGFAFAEAESADAFIPLRFGTGASDRGYNTNVIARLKPDMSLRQAQAQMAALSEQFRKASLPDADPGERGVRLQRYQEWLVKDMSSSLLLLFGAVGLVLLIACANVASLLLARAISRQKEISIRRALGAGQSRLLRQFFTESLLLALAGSAAGLLGAVWLLDSLVAAIPWDIAFRDRIKLDSQVLAFALLVAVGSSLVFGLASFFQSLKLDLNVSLKEGGTTSGFGTARTRSRKALVVAEVALCLMLLVGAGLLIESLHRLQQEKLGFDPNSLMTMFTPFSSERYLDTARIWEFERQALERIKGLPGVTSVATVTALPLKGVNNLPTQREGHPEHSIGGTEQRVISPQYFETMRIPVIRGRAFLETDSQSSPPVAVVNETLAQRWWPEGNPIGEHIVVGRFKEQRFPFEEPPREIVGVVGDVKGARLEWPAPPTLYVPAAQRITRWTNWVIRTQARMDLEAPLRQAFSGLDPELRVLNVQLMTQIVEGAVARQRFNTLAMGIFAAMALILAGVGLYGVISYSVAQQTHDIGVRIALGAKQSDVLKLVVGQGMKLALLGVALGLAGALFLTRFLTTLLYGVRPTDPSTFVGVSVVLTAVALLASYLPARRATKVDPMVALRYE
jgi:putative ABC transport system permease protein